MKLNHVKGPENMWQSVLLKCVVWSVRKHRKCFQELFNVHLFWTCRWPAATL